MKTGTAIKQAAIGAFEPLEELGRATKPLGQDAFKQIFGKDFGFFGEPGIPSSQPQELGHEELEGARKKQHLKDIDQKDQQQSEQNLANIKQAIAAEYKKHETKLSTDQQQLHEEVAQMQQEVVQLAKAAGVDTKIHLERSPKILGLVDLKRLTAIIRSLRIKAESAKSGSELVSKRQNAKAGIGMMAWVSGKQMKIHEQGTMQLQG